VTDANTVQASTLAKTGAGVLTLSASGNFTLTIPKTGTVPVGTGTAGRIAEWVTDANTVQASTLAKTGVGVLTLAASGNFTLTIPETGTAALLGTANAFTAGQTITTSTFPPLRVIRSTSGTNGVVASVDLLADTSGDMVDGFGPTFNFSIRDAAGGAINSIGGVAGIRDGADTSGAIVIYTRELGVQNNRFYVLANGNVGIGETSPTAQLQVEQTNAFGAKPTLRLQQLDLTREFIRFDTTVGAGNPVNTTALGTYYGRVRVWVEGVGEKWLALYNA
jgi:hypothetical protein